MIPLTELFWQRVARTPEAISSWSFREGRWQSTRWSETRDAVVHAAAGLLELGVGKGDRVAIAAPTRREWSQLDLAIQMFGGITVGVYPSASVAEVRSQLLHAGVRVVFVEDRAQAERLAPALAEIDGGRPILLDGAGDETLEALQTRGAARLRGAPDEIRRRSEDVRLDDVVTYVYTSGTTGDSKGVMLTHRNFAYVLDASRERLPYDHKRVMAFLPLAHALQRYASYLGLVADLDAHYGRSLDTVAEDLHTIGPQAFAAVPRILEKVHARVLAGAAATRGLRRAIFERAWPALIASGLHRGGGGPAPGLGTRLWASLGARVVGSRVRERLGGRVEFIGCGSAPLAREVQAFFEGIGIPILEGWGLSETTAPVTLSNLSARRIGSVGRPLDGTEVRVAADGELLVRGPGVFQGYYRDPAATAAALQDGWFQTGDVGSVDADGFVWITDRKKDLIITAGGKNVAPQPIERDLRLEPLIAHPIVLGDRRPYLVALLGLDPDVAAELGREAGVPPDDPEALARLPAVRARLDAALARANAERAPYQQLKAWAVLPAAPSVDSGELTPTLKLKRRVVEARHATLVDGLYG